MPNPNFLYYRGTAIKGLKQNQRGGKRRKCRDPTSLLLKKSYPEYLV